MIFVFVSTKLHPQNRKNNDICHAFENNDKKREASTAPLKLNHEKPKTNRNLTMKKPHNKYNKNDSQNQ